MRRTQIEAVIRAHIELHFYEPQDLSKRRFAGTSVGGGLVEQNTLPTARPMPGSPRVPYNRIHCVNAGHAQPALLFRLPLPFERFVPSDGLPTATS